MDDITQEAVQFKLPLRASAIFHRCNGAFSLSSSFSFIAVDMTLIKIKMNYEKIKVFQNVSVTSSSSLSS